MCYVGSCMVCGLFYVICAPGNKGCSKCVLLNGKWAVVGYVGCCKFSGLLYGMWDVEWYVGCCMVYGLLVIRAAVYVGC